MSISVIQIWAFKNYYQICSILLSKAVDGSSQIFLVVRTLHNFSQTQTTQQALLLRDQAPRDQRVGRLHDGLREQVPGQG